VSDADYNAYWYEQALQNLYDANFTNLEPPMSYSRRLCCPYVTLYVVVHTMHGAMAQCGCTAWSYPLAGLHVWIGSG
jgi:hypothetical protein